VVGPRRRRRFPFLLVAAVLVGLAVFGVVGLQALVSQSSFRIQQLDDRNTALQQSYGRLQLQVAQLAAPGRMVAEARRLGLRAPQQTETITVAGAVPPGQGLSRGKTSGQATAPQTGAP
jgi:cell division protein FtsL